MICLDKLTYGGTLSTLLAVMKKPNFRFDKEDNCDIAVVFALFEEEKPDVVINESWWSKIISGEYQNYDDLDIEDCIQPGIQNAERGTVEGHAFPMLPRLANGLVLLAHMRSHIRVGLGLRQMIDWMMYVERELDDAFWASEFQAAAKAKKRTCWS